MCAKILSSPVYASKFVFSGKGIALIAEIWYNITQGYLRKPLRGSFAQILRVEQGMSCI
jgi:hypothetical protein